MNSLPAKTDVDPDETREWLDSIESVLESAGPARTRFLVRRMIEHAQHQQIGLPALVQTPYINTIAPEDEPAYPGDVAMEKRVRRLIRWNAVVQVLRANKLFVGLGGHLSTYASAASLYEIGFNHFFRGKDHGDGGDQLFVQGHAAPGIYARAYLEGRLNEEQLDHFRRESQGNGLSSYPHPRLMPEFWEFPTVSMGLGPINAIYQARFNRYLHNRGLVDTSKSRVWAFLGDGECDEPETLGALSLAAREKLDNLTFIINCNLQRLDGPVRGNGKIVQELEAVFHGAGWNVIKVIWASEWDEIFEQDDEHVLVRRLTEIVDGDFQRLSVEDGAFVRSRLSRDNETIGKLLEPYSDEQLMRLRRGGHDYKKLYAAYSRAVEPSDQPTVILAKTVKGWALGDKAEGRNVTHQMKKLGEEELRKFRDRLELPIPDSELENPPYYHPGPDSDEVRYMVERREALGGFVPKRVVRASVPELPETSVYQQFREPGRGGVEFSTTMAFARLFRELLKDDGIKERLVPILSDEARTFGMEPLFKQIGIYAPEGQKYEPVDHALMFSYTESQDGQILQEGITECGCLASFTASGTSYATHGVMTIPFFIFYSMFGFQRVGDSIWSFGDQRGRGFLLGATAGRTTLNGEGLQHEDGHSLLVATTVPCCRAYDPAYHYEMATIIEAGLEAMVEKDEDVFYYITLYNENHDHPAMPEGSRDGILKGLYPVREAKSGGKCRARILGSGPILLQALAAADILESEFDVSVQVFSATSYQQLRRDALDKERQAILHPAKPVEPSYVSTMLPAGEGPVIAVSDYMKTVPEQISRWVEDDFLALGTDGFGMSDTREALRRYFEIDAESIVVATLSTLSRRGEIEASVVQKAIEKFGIDPDAPDPVLR